MSIKLDEDVIAERVIYTTRDGRRWVACANPADWRSYFSWEREVLVLPNGNLRLIREYKGHENEAAI